MVLGDLGRSVESALASLDAHNFGRRLAARDPWLWKSEPERIESIRNRLGWPSLCGWSYRSNELMSGRRRPTESSPAIERDVSIDEFQFCDTIGLEVPERERLGDEEPQLL
jgi:hypothetical protein